MKETGTINREESNIMPIFQMPDLADEQIEAWAWLIFIYNRGEATIIASVLRCLEQNNSLTARH